MLGGGGGERTVAGVRSDAREGQLQAPVLPVAVLVGLPRGARET